jgi:hypothetical protein
MLWRRMGEWMYRFTFFFTSALVGDCSASRPGRFTPGERAPGTHWIGGWVGPWAGLNDVEERKFLTLPTLDLWSFGRPARSQSLYRLRYSEGNKKQEKGTKKENEYREEREDRKNEDKKSRRRKQRQKDMTLSQQWLRGTLSSETLRRVVWSKLIDIPGKCNAPIFRVEEEDKHQAQLLVAGSEYLLPWRWSQYVPPKRRTTSIRLHDILQKTVFFTECKYLHILKKESVVSTYGIDGSGTCLRNVGNFFPDMALLPVRQKS